MVEQEAVNFEVAGSSPAVGAIKNPLAFASGFFMLFVFGAKTGLYLNKQTKNITLN